MSAGLFWGRNLSLKPTGMLGRRQSPCSPKVFRGESMEGGTEGGSVIYMVQMNPRGSPLSHCWQNFGCFVVMRPETRISQFIQALAQRV